jgi:alkylation response protein AidB-like acyl-CoA dehydrogenase
MQLANFIVPVAQAEKAICFALTEAEAGSDAGALQTRPAEGDTYVLNGRKRFISGSPFADYAVLMASTSDSPERREISAFFVDLRQPGARGVGLQDHGRPVAPPATSCSATAACPHAPHRRARPRPRAGAGAHHRQPPAALPRHGGPGRVALKDARDYARTRRQFGRPIAAVPGHPAHAGRHGDELAAARALMISTARQLDAGGEARADASMAKLFCSESAFRIADAAVQIHGGEGIVQGRRVEFLFRMLRMYRVLTGTSEIQKNIIARELIGEAL